MRGLDVTGMHPRTRPVSDQVLLRCDRCYALFQSLSAISRFLVLCLLSALAFPAGVAFMAMID